MQKSRRQRGLQYKGLKKDPVSGKWVYSQQKEPRQLKPFCKLSSGNNSKLKCRSIGERDRKHIFKCFWKTLDWSGKKTYVTSLVDVCLAKDKKNKQNEISRRTYSYKFYLKLNGARVRVCRTMFLNTLGLGRWTVSSWIQNLTNMPTTEEASGSDSDEQVDEDSCQPKKSKRSRLLSDKNLIDHNKHLEGFLKDLPKMESHYCRRDTGKLYFETIWNSIMELIKYYEQVCKSEMFKF